MMTLHTITAMTKDRVIGREGRLPWSIPEESRLFRELTAGNVVIMGGNTWLSLPERFRPLPGRTNIIVSTTLPRQRGAAVVATVAAALEAASAKYDCDAFCIGGARLYAAMLPLSQVLDVSWIKGDYPGNTRFPEVDFDNWRVVETRDYEEFTYKRYLRKGE